MSPAWLEGRTTCQYGQKRGCWRLIEHQIQQCEGRGVRPVEVFDDEQHRVTFCVFLQDRHDGFERLLALALWGEVQWRIVMLRKRHREQRRKELDRLLQGQSILT